MKCARRFYSIIIRRFYPIYESTFFFHNIHLFRVFHTKGRKFRSCRILIRILNRDIKLWRTKTHRILYFGKCAFLIIRLVFIARGKKNIRAPMWAIRKVGRCVFFLFLRNWILLRDFSCFKRKKNTEFINHDKVDD